MIKIENKINRLKKLKMKKKNKNKNKQLMKT